MAKKKSEKRKKPEQDGGDELLQWWRSLRRSLREYKDRTLAEARNASRVARRCEKREFAVLTGDKSLAPSEPMQRITIPPQMATIVDVLREARPILEWLRVRNAPLHDSLRRDLGDLDALDKKCRYDEAWRKAEDLCFAFGNAVRETWREESPAGTGGEGRHKSETDRKPQGTFHMEKSELYVNRKPRVLSDSETAFFAELANDGFVKSEGTVERDRSGTRVKARSVYRGLSRKDIAHLVSEKDGKYVPTESLRFRRPRDSAIDYDTAEEIAARKVSKTDSGHGFGHEDDSDLTDAGP